MCSAKRPDELVSWGHAPTHELAAFEARNEIKDLLSGLTQGGHVSQQVMPFLQRIQIQVGMDDEDSHSVTTVCLYPDDIRILARVLQRLATQAAKMDTPRPIEILDDLERLHGEKRSSDDD